MRQFLLTVGLLALIPHSATAQWVWSTETGWVNSRYIGTNNAQTLIARARQMEKGNQHQDASKAFEKIAKQYPKSKHAREALYSAAESKFKQSKHYEANKLYEEYLDKYQKDHQHKHITKRRYEIGRALVRGEKRKLMGLKLLSDENIDVRRVAKGLPRSLSQVI